MAITFNGTDQKLNIANESFFDFLDADLPFSFSSWVYQSALDSGGFLSKANNSGPKGVAFNTQSNQGPTFSFHMVVDATHDLLAYGPNACFSLNTFAHIAATYDGSRTLAGVKMYVNGVNVPHGTGSNLDVNTIGAGSIQNNDPLRIGGIETEFSACSVSNAIVCDYVLSALEVSRLADLSNLDTAPSSYLSSPPKIWLPMTSSTDLADASGNGNNATAVNSPTSFAEPRVAFDTGTPTTITSTGSFTHTPVAAPIRGLVLFIIQDTSSADRISSVTYGGVTMTRILFAQDTAGEQGASYAYFLGEGVPAGAQTVNITVSAGTESKRIAILSLLGRSNLRVAASGKQEGDAANPSVTLGTLGTYNGISLGGLFSGQDAPASVTVGSGYKQLMSFDFGTQLAVVEFGQKNGSNVVVDYVSTSDDVALATVAVEPISSVAWLSA